MLIEIRNFSFTLSEKLCFQTFRFFSVKLLYLESKYYMSQILSFCQEIPSRTKILNLYVDPDPGFL
jgi:hypothetical protein